MLSVLIFLLLISSGSIFSSVYYEKRFEETLPITIGGLILIVYLFGLVGKLNLGVLVFILISLCLYGLSIYKAIKEKKIKELIKNTLTVGFFIFLAFVVVFYVSIGGKLLDTCDEFSHWGDIVKIMSYRDTFGAWGNTGSMFKSYPPSMSIFQYALVKVNYYLTGEKFVEWLCYMAYDLLAISLFLPFTKDFKINNPIKIAAFMFCFIMVPFIFYENSYSSLYIDLFIGLLIAVGGMELLNYDNKDLFGLLRIISIAFILTLVKDSGILFAISIVLGCIFLIIKSDESFKSKNSVLKYISLIGIIIFAKLSWSTLLKARHAVIAFGNKITVGDILGVFNGTGPAYRRQVLSSFLERYLTHFNIIGNTNIELNYPILLFISFVFAAVIYLYVSRCKNDRTSKLLTALAVLYISSLVFIAGTCFAYMFKFSEEEALALASFARYIRTVYVGIFMFGNLAIIQIIDKNDLSILTSIVCMTIALIATPMECPTTLLSGAFVQASINVRNDNYGEIINKTMEATPSGSMIWYIHQYGSSDDALVYRFAVRPNIVGGENSIGTSDYPDDYYEVELTAEEWKQQLTDLGYDYVAIQSYSEEFKLNYESLFENVDDIDDNTIFAFDNKTGKLSLVE